MRKRISRKFAAVLALSMILSCMMVPSAVFGGEAVSADITVIANGIPDKDDPYVIRNIRVYSDSAEKEGYTDEGGNSIETVKDKVTCMDALVALHEKVYGNEFKASPEKYLGFEESSYGGLMVVRMFGIENPAMMSYVNNADSGVSIDSTVLGEGDLFRPFILKDNAAWSDKYLFFDELDYSAEEGEMISINLFEAGYDSNYQSVALPHKGRTVVLKSEDGETVKSDEPTDENGKVVFDNLKAGKYVVSVEAFSDTDYFAMPWAEVSVSEKTSDNPSGIEDTDENNDGGEKTSKQENNQESDAETRGNEASPATGDSFSPVLAGIIAVLALAAAAAVTLRKRI